MDFSGTQTIAVPIEKVWVFLMDVNKVAACAPGFQSLEVLGEEHWKAAGALGVGGGKNKSKRGVTRTGKGKNGKIEKEGRGKKRWEARGFWGGEQPHSLGRGGV